MDKAVIVIKRIYTPLGTMTGGATEQGICLLEFEDETLVKSGLADLKRLLNRSTVEGENMHILQLEEELTEYFNGKRRSFTVSLHTPGTAFQNLVWDMLKEIPYGETRSYQQQAIRLGQIKAIRAVASANAHNRIAIIIPCHRVIGKNGSLTGYAGGLERKRALLNHERQHAPLKDLFSGIDLKTCVSSLER